MLNAAFTTTVKPYFSAYIEIEYTYEMLLVYKYVTDVTIISNFNFQENLKHLIYPTTCVRIRGKFDAISWTA